MSVVATSVSGLSSILKSPRIRNRNTEQRVRFRLPENLRTILLDFTNRKNIKYYEELIYTIRDGDVQVSIFKGSWTRGANMWMSSSGVHTEECIWQVHSSPLSLFPVSEELNLQTEVWNRKF
jgi:hypothetical protein